MRPDSIRLTEPYRVSEAFRIPQWLALSGLRLISPYIPGPSAG